MTDPHQREWDARHAAAAGPGTPSPFVVRALLRLGSGPGRVLDLACGQGRHALLFARHGWTVDAVDWSPAALAGLAARARAAGLAIRCLAADVTRWAPPAATYDVVVVTAFLDRTLFAGLGRAVRPGGALVYETFLVAQAQWEHPRNPEHLVRPGELGAAFAGWTTLDACEGTTARQGRPAALAALLARRPG